MIKDHQSFIFIPDITGFTNYVNSTEIEHGQHIISELLEIIIDADQLGMTVSEVEGDAVLFYLHEQLPTPHELLEQTKNIFIKFHAHLKRYEKERICQCGACATATGLSLKFIAHAGKIGFTKVKKTQKPYGLDLIISHKLLKNTVPEKEYLLVSDSLLKSYAERTLVWPEQQPLVSLTSSYEELGDVTHHHTGLAELKLALPEVLPLKNSALTPNPAVESMLINAAPNVIYNVLVDLNSRVLWNKGVKAIETDSNRVNRLGTKHRCLFDAGTADFVTITNDFGSEKLVYGEKIVGIKLTKEINIYHILEEQSIGVTLLRSEIHVRSFPIISLIVVPLIKSKMRTALLDSLSRLKSLVESDSSS